jgi:hypothetical protein
MTEEKKFDAFHAFEHPGVCSEWYRDSNYLAFLSVKDEREL